ncbi:hypothetical protein [Mucilaginibacter gynuensis]|uniref:hypothetical protein n=1 Tax=Mucilaginibacter gynuensis TaxID=1302236 RepID=UPI0031E563E4
MKSNKIPATSKLVAKFDQQLMDILREDLRSFKAKNQFLGINKQEAAKHRLSAA